MADEDKFGLIIDNCRYSSSQDDLLRHSKFAREDEFFTGDDGRKSHTPEDLAAGKELDVSDNTGGTNRGIVGADTTNLGFPRNRENSSIEVLEVELERPTVRDREIPLKPSSIEPPLKKSRVSSLKSPEDLAAGKELDVADNTGGTNRGKIAVFGADTTNLGFPRNRENSSIEVLEVELERPTVRDSEIFLKPSSIEPPLKKSRVSSLKSPLVHCSEKVVIEIEENSKQVVVLKSGVKVEIVSPLRCVAPGSVQSVEKLGFNDDNNNQDNKINGENSAKKKLEFGGDNTEEKEIEIENIKRQEKRELPRSIIGQVWGVTQDENGVFGNGNEEVGLNQKSVGRSHEIGKSKGCEAMSCLLDVLRMLARDSYDNDISIDIFETVKKRGMTFPQSRFLSEMEEKE